MPPLPAMTTRRAPRNSAASACTESVSRSTRTAGWGWAARGRAPVAAHTSANENDRPSTSVSTRASRSNDAASPWTMVRLGGAKDEASTVATEEKEGG